MFLSAVSVDSKMAVEDARDHGVFLCFGLCLQSKNAAARKQQSGGSPEIADRACCRQRERDREKGKEITVIS